MCEQQNQQNVKCCERTFLLPFELQVAAKCWGLRDAPTRILCLHGFMDNAGTFDLLAPMLVRSLNARVVCTDFLGHGHSSHLTPYTDYTLRSKVLEVVSVLRALGWEKCSIVAHSMGGAVAVLLSAIMPMFVERVVLIDSLGPWIQGAQSDIIPFLQKSIRVREKLHKKSQKRIYPNLDAAVSRYLAGWPKMQRASATHIVERGTKTVEVDADVDGEDEEKPDRCKSVKQSSGNRHALATSSKGLVFRHDPLLRVPPSCRFSALELETFAKNVKQPVLALVTELMFDIQDRACRFPNIIVKAFPEQSHHVHLDNVDLIFPYILEFFTSKKEILHMSKL